MDTTPTPLLFDYFTDDRESGVVEPSDFDLFMLDCFLGLQSSVCEEEQGVSLAMSQPEDIPSPVSLPCTPQLATPPPVSTSPTTQSPEPLIIKPSHHRSTKHHQTQHNHVGRSLLPSDKRFPTPLLKCPLAVFKKFVDGHQLDADLVEDLRAARRRKKNRMFQRVTRNRQTRGRHPVEAESDDEGECNSINEPAVYAQLIENITHDHIEE